MIFGDFIEIYLDTESNIEDMYIIFLFVLHVICLSYFGDVYEEVMYTTNQAMISIEHIQYSFEVDCFVIFVLLIKVLFPWQSSMK